MKEIDNDILIDGIINYTKNGKLEWTISYERDLATDFKAALKISKIKEIDIKFHCNYRDINKSGISIFILIEPNRSRNYKYLTVENLKANRFLELSKLINKQLKRSII